MHDPSDFATRIVKEPNLFDIFLIPFSLLCDRSRLVRVHSSLSMQQLSERAGIYIFWLTGLPIDIHTSCFIGRSFCKRLDHEFQ